MARTFLDTHADDVTDQTTALQAPLTPGQVLRERFLRPLNITQRQVADALGVSQPRLNQLLSDRNGIKPEMALRLERALGTDPRFWLEMQMEFDLVKTRERLRGELYQIQLIGRAAPHAWV